MADNGEVWFDQFRLDMRGELLWHAHERRALSPKAFAILRYLVEHQGQLVTKASLLDAIWPDTVVGEAVLTVGIAELRKALGDDPRAPRFIETVHRRGYRFLAAVVADATPLVPSSQSTGHSSPLPSSRREALGVKPDPLLVGRDDELLQLHQLFDTAAHGKRQVVFVTGEAGNGKTTLVDTFLHSLASRVPRPGSEAGGEARRLQARDPIYRSGGTEMWVGSGQCVEHYSAGEAYFPVLEALTRLCRAPDGTAVLDMLRLHAPTWLLQMPALLSPTERDQLRQQGYTTTRDRMVRELADAVAAVAATQTLVLVFEDLHWSDYATLDVLSTLARRPEPARLLVIGTYRPAEVVRGQHPLRIIQQELHAHRHCTVLPLAGLTAADIAAHLHTRFPRHRFPAALAQVLHQRTNGNPLFLVNMLDELQAQGAIVEQGGQWALAVDVETIAVRIPASTRALIEQHVERLSPTEQRVLEAASVAGVEFTVGAVAAAVDIQLPDVEAQCEHLARQGQFLRTAEVRTLPGGTLTAQYAFVHALYQGTIYDRIGAARRIRVHRTIAHWLETVAGEYVGEIAAELAVHYEQGREYERAVHYLEQAARKALGRGAAYEAIRHLRAALRLLPALPQTAGHAERELTLQTLLAPALLTAKGYATVEVEQIYNRVLALAQRVEDFPRVFPVLAGVAAFHIVRGEYLLAQEIATHLLQGAQREQETGLLVEAHVIMGVVAFYRGEFTAARTQLEYGLALYDPRHHQVHALHYGQDPWVACCSYLAWTLWTLGYPDQAQERSREAIAYARKLRHPMSLAFALGLAGILQNVCQDPQAGYDRAEELVALAREHELPYWVAQGIIVRGRALVQSGRAHEGLAQIQQAMQVRREQDGLGRRPPLAILAEAYAATEEIDAGLQALAEAQVTTQRDTEYYWEAEVYRLKGELLLAHNRRKDRARRKKQKTANPPPQSEISDASAVAEACLAQALDIARRQCAKSLELRAAVSLARWWQHKGKQQKAYTLLSNVYCWFTEGFATKDLQEAKTLLDQWAAPATALRTGTSR